MTPFCSLASRFSRSSSIQNSAQSHHNVNDPSPTPHHLRAAANSRRTRRVGGHLKFPIFARLAPDASQIARAAEPTTELVVSRVADDVPFVRPPNEDLFCTSASSFVRFRPPPNHPFRSNVLPSPLPPLLQSQSVQQAIPVPGAEAGGVTLPNFHEPAKAAIGLDGSGRSVRGKRVPGFRREARAGEGTSAFPVGIVGGVRRAE